MFYGKGSSVLIPGFDSFLFREANSTVRVTIKIRHSNSFTHEPLWVVTHTAWETLVHDCMYQVVLNSETTELYSMTMLWYLMRFCVTCSVWN